MLPKKHRFQINEEWSAALARLKRRAGGTLLSFRFGASESDVRRIAIIIPKKIVKKSVRRSRIKRVLLDEIKKNKFYLGDAVDIIVQVKKGDPGNKEYEYEKKLREEVSEVFNKIK